MTEANSEVFQGRRGRWTILVTQLLHYGVALLSVALAVGTNLLLSSYLAPTLTPPFFAAVMVSTWYGGLGPGLLATALSTLAINYFLVEPLYSLNIPNLGTLARLGVFVMAAILINSLNAAQRSAQRRAEANLQALQESEARFGRLAESNIIGMIVADLNGPILEANNIFLQMVGYTQEELRSGRVRWREMTPPESLEVSERAVQELITTGVCSPFEKEYIRKDGSRVPVLHGATLTGETTIIGFVLDLSERKRGEAERKRAQETLERTNQTLQTLLDACPVAIAFFDPQGIVRLWNRAAERIFGWSASEAIGQFMPTVPHRPQEFLASIQTVLSGRSLDGLEARHQHKDGRMVDLEIWANLTHDAQGNPGCLGIAWDITQRKQAEANLSEQRRLLEIILRNAADAIIVCDATGKLTFANPQARRLAQQDPNDTTVDLDLCNWGTAYDTDGNLIPLEHYAISKALRGEVNNVVESRMVRADGSYYDILISAAPLLNDGQIVGAVANFIDISDRKRAEEALRTSEERFQLIVQATNDVIWDCHLSTHQMWWSERIEVVFGYQPEQLGSDMSGWIERVHPDDLERVYANYKTCLNSEQTLWTDEYRFRRADDSYADILDRAYIIRDSAGNPVRVVGAMSDISDRKQSEAALRQSEERLRVALKNSPITVFNQDRNLCYTWLYNPTLEYHTTQVMGKQDTDLLSSEDATVLTQIKRRVLETGVGVQEEVKLTMQAQDFYYDLTVEPLPDVDGEIIGITCASINITDRKQVELALRQSETTLSAFIASSPIGIAFFDHDLRYIHANDALAAVNGVPLSEHLGRTLWDVLPQWAPVVAPILEQVMQTKEPLLNQEVVGATYPADVVRHALVNYFPVCLPDGQVLGLGVTSMDITDRRRTEEALRRSEERLRISQELSLDAFTILDSVRDETGAIVDFVWTYVNPKAAEILQHPVQKLVGQRLLEILPGNQTNSELFERYVRVVETGVAHDLELSYNTDGVTGWFRNMAVKLEDGVAISFSDITQRKQAEVEREQLLVREQTAREQAEAANRIKDEFLAVLSHELRSPLNPILGWSKLLQTGKLDAQASHRALETIERNAKLQTQLIEDLLDVSRILRGKMALNISSINLVTMVESALETVRLAAEAKHIQIHTVVTLDNAQVSGDSARLQQIVWNLLSNAIKFTPDGGKVEIRLDSIGTYAQIQVRDTGIGISPDFLPYVFDYFRQEDGKITRKFGGLGLGLAIVRHLTELHGGIVYAESCGEGQGATFTVRLPLIAVAAASAQEISKAAQSVDLSQLQILVVDDEEDMRDLVRVILEQQGAQVTVATTAAEALMIFDRQPPDILISDIGMPDLDGYMLMQQVRQRSPQAGKLIRAIALTAYAGEYDQRQALQAGFQKHIPKPVEPEVLVNAISELMISVHS